MKGGGKTIPESERVHFSAILKQVRDAQPHECTEHQFPATLTSSQRAFIHGLATKYGLNSKSYGKGESRALKISQPILRTDAVSDDKQFPEFNPGPQLCSLLKSHCGRFPASSEEVSNVLQGETTVALAKPKHIPQSNNFNPNPDLWEKAQNAMTSNSKYATVLKSRSKLPAWDYRDRVVSMVANSQVSLISGETGCGKTTQVPQFLLDDETLGPAASIVCTQPRRISAMSVAERIAQERCEEVGRSVGYAVRAASANGRQLNFVTPGLLLRRLGSDPSLSKYNIIIIDEVHEQDKYSEFLLILLRRLLPRRPDLRVVLMSATLRADVFSNYFHGCPRLDIGVSVFPVATFFLEDSLVQSNYKRLGENAKFGAEPMIDWGEETLADDTLNNLWSQSDGATLEATPFPLTNNAITPCTSRTIAADLNLSFKCAMCQSGFATVEELGDHAALCFGEPIAERVTSPPVPDSAEITEKIEESAQKAEIASVLNRYLSQCGDEDEVDLKLILHLLGYIVDLERNGEGGIEGAAAAASGGGGKRGKKGKKKSEANDSWSEVTDPASGDVYYWNQKTGQTSWDKPKEKRQVSQQASSKIHNAVLVFLPGWNEISNLQRLLETEHSLGAVNVLPLHSGVPLAEQRKVFQRAKPGVIKIVLATNIAETSLTIEDIAYVIDSGRSKEQSYDCHMRIQVVRSGWVSKASARQRRGRAGRTRQGMCWHLFSKERHDHALEEFKTSELLRTPLEELVLQAKYLNLAPGCGPDDETSVYGFLGSAMTPPNPTAISNAVELLTQLGGLGGAEDLTKLGALLASLPVEPRVGKMLLWAHFFGLGHRAPALAASMSSKSVFTIPLHGQKTRRTNDKSNLNVASDQLTNLYTMETVMALPYSSRWRWCEDRAISATAASSAYDLGQQITNELNSLSVGRSVITTEDNHTSLSALVGVALYPNIARRLFSETNFSTSTGRKCKLASQSVNKSSKTASEAPYEVIGFNDLTQGRSNFIANDSTVLHLLPLFFMSTSVDIDSLGSEESESVVITVDGWMKLQSSRDVALNMAIITRRLREGFAMYISAGKKKAALPPHLVDAAKTVSFVLQSN